MALIAHLLRIHTHKVCEELQLQASMGGKIPTPYALHEYHVHI